MWPSPEIKFLIRNHNVCWWRFIISNRNFWAFSTVSNLVHYHMIKWFAANNLVLNLDETDVIKLVINNSLQCLLSIGYKGKNVEETINAKFHGLQIDCHLHWKNRVDQIGSVSHIFSTDPYQFIWHIFAL